jgi:hypothetical protein
MEISGVFTLPVDKRWSQSQTRRVQIDCDTSVVATTLNLPTVQSVVDANASEVEIIVNDSGDNSSVRNITIVPNAAVSDTIEGAANLVINTDKASVVLKIGGRKTWVVL